MLSKGHKTNADKILSAWLIGLGIHLFLYYLYFSGKYTLYPSLLGLSIPLPLVHGPFLYLYTASVTNQSQKWKISLLHFLPVLISFLSFINFFRLPNETKILIYRNDGLGFETLTLLNFIAVICSGIIYIIWSLILLKKHKKNIVNQFSYSEKINLNWLQYLIYGIGIIWLFVFFGSEELLFSSVVLFVIFIGYFGINQVGVFSTKTLINKTDDNSKEIFSDLKFSKKIIVDENKSSKYVKSGLNKETSLKIHELLTKKVEDEKLYTNPELTLVELAEILEVHPNNLSQVINTFEDKNFYDYINSKRIDHFIELISISENKKFTILSLAFECGFNSKSSFNKYFKKVTNLTPSEYLKKTI
nr:helix-turn-helix domain-containing protein [uncultured Flavobacterium sp.]